MSAPPEQPVFYYDLGDPACYLIAEAILSALPVVPEWEPVLAAWLGIDAAPPDRSAVERRAAELEVQELRWPPQVPVNAETAMLAATYAKRSGRAVAFSLAAFRQAFAAGRDLGELDTVLLAGAACEIHPSAMVKGIELRGIRTALETACNRARTAGVTALPALQIGSAVFAGERMLERAAAQLGAGVR